MLAKPSELAPACSAALARLLPRYVDPDAVVVVEGGVDETTALLAERWDHIFFTGSTAVGRVVAEAAAKHLTPTVLELGGKSPTYVHRSADLDVAARRIAWGKFLNAGQTCIAPDYVLVDHQVKDAFVDKLGRQIGEFYGADPKAQHELRPHRQRSPRRAAAGLPRRQGAGTVATGGQVDAAERFVAPTVTVEPSTETPADAGGDLRTDPARARRRRARRGEGVRGRPAQAARPLRVRAAGRRGRRRRRHHDAAVACA